MSQDHAAAPDSAADGEAGARRRQVEAFRTLLREDESLQRQLREATSAAALAAVVQGAGIPLSPADLVRDFALRLLEGDDARVIEHFDNCGWDQGELAWLYKIWS
ncbi:MAG: Nif11 family protein [Synechococcaceae cyanobacterium]|nr:Nif11 family protein [Synechococcaceae cyanobacterium]